MYMSIAIFYQLIFRRKIAKRYYELIKQVFQDSVFTFTDYFMVFSVILHYARQLIIGRILALSIKTAARDWLKH